MKQQSINEKYVGTSLFLPTALLTSCPPSRPPSILPSLLMVLAFPVLTSGQGQLLWEGKDSRVQPTLPFP